MSQHCKSKQSKYTSTHSCTYVCAHTDRHQTTPGTFLYLYFKEGPGNGPLPGVRTVVMRRKLSCWGNARVSVSCFVIFEYLISSNNGVTENLQLYRWSQYQRVGSQNHFKSLFNSMRMLKQRIDKEQIPRHCLKAKGCKVPNFRNK